MQTRGWNLLSRLILVLVIGIGIMLFSITSEAYAQEGDPPPTLVPEIVGGGPSVPGEWAWQVALIDGAGVGPNFRDDQFCGGSLVHPQWVLTAGHCITDMSGNVQAASSVDIIAGIYNLSNPAAGYQRRDVTQIIRHPSYNDSTLDYDIALLRLSGSVTIGGSGETATALVPLVPAGIGELVGTGSWVTGWGNTRSVPEWPDQLQEIQLPIMANSLCNDANHYGGMITGNMLCAGYDAGGLDACQGDSGGPMVVNHNGQWKQAGIVSWGTQQCAVTFSPGVYTRVSQFGSWVNQNIGLASLVSPSGSIGTNYNPTYTWNAVNTMTWYYLWINGPSGKIYDKWYTAAEVGCGSGTGACSVTPDIPLAGGNHTWWIQTWNEAGPGPWSEGKTFSTNTLSVPGKATLNSPSGTIATNNPTYTWNEVSDATWYYLWISGPSGKVLDKWYTSTQANCNGTTCSVAGATPGLSVGTHTWWVQTWNNAGDGPWSDAKTFNPPTPPLPGQATLLSPTGSIGTNNPTYEWNEVADATWYYLWVDGPSGNVLKQWYTSAQAGCNGTTCSIASATPGLAGAYTWKVQTWNSTGTGPWSDVMNFAIPNPLPRQPTSIGPNASTTDLTPTYTWNAVSSDTGDPATWYYLWVNGPSGAVLNQWYTAAQAGCTGGTGMCAITPTETLIPGGTYTWWVQGWNDAGTGPWSSDLSFSIASIGGLNSQFNGSSTGWTPYYGAWSIASNQWYYAPGDDNYYVSSGYNGANYRNFDFQTRVSTTTPHEAYLLVRGTPAPLDAWQDWNSAYYFGFDGYGYYMVGKMVNGSWTTMQPWTYSPYLVQGGNWNVLRVVASDNNLYYYINGMLVWSGVDYSLTSGKIGFELGTTPSYGLWVDWATVNSYAEDMLVITDTVSPEQQALNDAANANGSDKTDGGYHK